MGMILTTITPTIPMPKSLSVSPHEECDQIQVLPREEGDGVEGCGGGS